MEKHDLPICITIDVDWACDEVLAYTIDFFEAHEMKATFFITHDTPLLTRLRKSPLFELGVHPNFQYLLNGTSPYHDMEEALDAILDIVPEAVSVRSHCLVQSSPLLDLFKRKGLKNDVNLFIPWENRISLKPIRHWNGLTRIPYCWEDDVACITGNWFENYEDIQAINGVVVMNFHPIHLFLNTENLERYEQARQYLHVPGELEKMRYKGTKCGAMSTLEIISVYGRRTMRLIKEIGECL